jgi:pimeloyl-ACP methyl ester carboxylesterase
VREEVRVPDDRLRSFRSLFIDGDETSTYDVSLTCEGERCGPPAHIAPTRYPIYFAHGFNSSAASWDGLRRLLHDSHGWPAGWTEAGDVPGFEPVERRAEILREHLTRWLGRFRPPAGEPFMRINVVAHSMGGLDARYLLAAPEYNEGCDAAPGRTPSGKCMLDEEGRVIHWRDRIASITTLSTPHCGSTFASWGLEKLHRSRGGLGILDWTFRTASRRVLGGEPQTVEATLEALSVEYHLDEDEPTDFNVMCAGRRLPFDARRTLGRHALVDPDALHARARHYDFSRATADAGYLSGLGIPPEHRPQGDRLPGPFIERGGRQVPISGTVFAWAGVTCLDGSCGNVVDVALAVPHGIESDNAPHTPNDGVVTVESARFGIYMGTRSNDHFHWSPYEEGHVSRAFRWLAGGHESEPVEGFHLWWAARLAAAGY